ncbi:hypothetical protein D3C78_1532950 [compost metagenome]
MVGLQVLGQHIALVEDAVALLQAGLQDRPGFRRNAALGGLARRQAFQHAAHLHGASDVRLGHLAHRVAAAAGLDQQALLLQRAQRHAHRHARDLQAFGGGNLDDALARRQLAGGDHLAQFSQHALAWFVHGLGFRKGPRIIARPITSLNDR